MTHALQIIAIIGIVICALGFVVMLVHLVCLALGLME